MFNHQESSLRSLRFEELDARLMLDGTTGTTPLQSADLTTGPFNGPGSFITTVAPAALPASPAFVNTLVLTLPTVTTSADFGIRGSFPARIFDDVIGLNSGLPHVNIQLESALGRGSVAGAMSGEGAKQLQNPGPIQKSGFTAPVDEGPNRDPNDDSGRLERSRDRLDAIESDLDRDDLLGTALISAVESLPPTPGPLWSGLNLEIESASQPSRLASADAAIVSLESEFDSSEDSDTPVHPAAAAMVLPLFAPAVVVATGQARRAKDERRSES